MTVIKAVITTLDNLPILKEQVRILRAESLISEIVVVNNGSRDGTREWLEAQSTRTVALHRENCGAGPGRNAGLDRAGEFDYVLLLDGGVQPIIGGVEKMLEFLEMRTDVDVLGFDPTDTEINPDLATTRWLEPISSTYRNTRLSETAYCLARARAFDGIRFSEEGPFGEPGWGVDDNEMLINGSLPASLSTLSVVAFARIDGRRAASSDYLMRRAFGPISMAPFMKNVWSGVSKTGPSSRLESSGVSLG